jgi:8-oxoguanine DNA glycosylase-like protein
VNEPCAHPLPDWVAEEVRRTPASTVLEQAVDVPPRWWREKLGARGLADELFDAPDDQLDRAYLFGLGKQAADSPGDARRLLWATLAWGTGRRHRNNRSRIRAVTESLDASSETLRRAAELGRTDPEGAYRVLRPHANAVRFLGPPFFTKFLYFAGGGSPTHRCLILDSMVARSLRRHCGWASLTGRYAWSSGDYVAYCDLLACWSAQLSDSTAGELVTPDRIEYVLFRRGRAA